jgi:ferredoxin
MSESRVTIDRDACTGHGRCYVLSPTIFAPDDEGAGVVSVAIVRTPEELQAAHTGAANCPERAISVVEVGTEGVGG